MAVYTSPSRMVNVNSCVAGRDNPHATVYDSHSRDKGIPNSTTGPSNNAANRSGDQESSSVEWSSYATTSRGPSYTPLPLALKKVVHGLTSIPALLASFASNVTIMTIPNAIKELNTWASHHPATTPFLLGLGLAPAVWGPLANQLGSFPAFILMSVVCTAASVGCTLAQTDLLLLGLRLMQASCDHAEVAPAKKPVRQSAPCGGSLGVLVVSQMLAFTLGAALGGYVTDAWSEEWCFWTMMVFLLKHRKDAVDESLGIEDNRVAFHLGQTATTRSTASS
ncbi:hypothetical protein IWQ60_002344 [Tieghemiomyces parasiticus]|uniref:Uncharacterized protein n=1 Tax=Tieghemiomyces parasiticus TaxID=78921 RepID=A0A9W8E133_9FUNG|nr:hypothetical protein IWQ60_002344 [Tieghemiomyces parasiticus]